MRRKRVSEIRIKDRESSYDPIMSFFGAHILSNDAIQELRKQNLELKRKGERLYDIMPQEGFQENVLLSEASIVIAGGKRGLGKTFVALEGALEYAQNPEVSMYGFRKYEDDISRGIWKSSKPVFKGFATATESSFEWSFLGGQGATMKMEHLQDLTKIKDRFRGVEMAYIVIEELAEHTRDNLSVLFDLLTSNRSTAGVTPKCVCTCNPVGRSNKLRYLLDWWIDPETDMAIMERNGKIRYFFRFGDDVSEIAWGDTPEEVYENINVKGKIDSLMAEAGLPYSDFITSLCFITGDYHDNEILRVSDKDYMKRISAGGSESTINDIIGVWRDVDSGTGMLSVEDMNNFFDNINDTGDGIMRASADVALTGDFFTIYAFCGHNVCDVEAWIGVPTNDVVNFIRNFLNKNGIREENFTYDSNGLGLWLKDDFPNALPFNNKSASSDTRLWNNLKSESAEKFVKAFKHKDFSISEGLLLKKYTDKKGHSFTLRDRLMDERKALKRKDTTDGRFEIISKQQMKIEIGHSPDFIEGFFMVMPLFDRKRRFVREGFDCF